MPAGSSLPDWFFKRWPRGTPQCHRAQRNFCESLAAYSLITYILQVKDRHNGNLLIDADGHVVHIDFGFMISNSPGNMSFETAPFKLTREFLEVMDSSADGKASELFDYFKVLCIQGFLAVRRHTQRITVVIECMKNSGFPCFRGGQRAIEALKQRFHEGITEEKCMKLVLQLISESMDAWRTRQYDYYQRVLNGIM
jgi:phosphatidylinositol 4-kinase B